MINRNRFCFNFAFKLNLRRYTFDAQADAAGRSTMRRVSIANLGEAPEAAPSGKRLLAVPAPSAHPVDLLMSLHQVEGDWVFVMDLLEGYCTGALEQVERCRRAAHAADTEVLGFEAGAYTRPLLSST
jgi:hypothetical protein